MDHNGGDTSMQLDSTDLSLEVRFRHMPGADGLFELIHELARPLGQLLGGRPVLEVLLSPDGPCRFEVHAKLTGAAYGLQVSRSGPDVFTAVTESIDWLRNELERAQSHVRAFHEHRHAGHRSEAEPRSTSASTPRRPAEDPSAPQDRPRPLSWSESPHAPRIWPV